MDIKRRLNENLTIFKSLRFPFKCKKKSFNRYKVTVGIGGNVGDVKRRFEHLFVNLKKDKRIELLQTSLILKNPPFGFEAQDDFFNSIIVLQVNMQPLVFLRYLHSIENKFARKRSFANAPRTLDLDIIFFDNRIVKTNRLVIPHAQWAKRDSVVIPLEGLK
ncbi:2-amino-4-hydroxy-6-hydroxymethyldihydropteridine diphosphokinase [Sulfurimonas sp.]|uniref:2-amino-4-hydroxy-6- hydroxymethyldihydropteridine diphosphokinase n=1 Tax=Sulfurimonas sp. TaxID=2022749 RepID=UPI002AAF93F7|nr:2-amino-4-hydroxy-6-hydroxymethyldihydropteridine diphosphokinase [Sulfurimonas sp.]